MRRTSHAAVVLAAALLGACGGGGAAPVTPTDPGGGGTPGTPTTPGTPPSTPGTPPAASTATIDGIDDAFSPSEVTIAAGGTVTWRMVDEEHDVTWTAAAPPGGNTGRIDDDEPISRTFPEAGSYPFTCARHDHEHGGTVTVTDGSAPPTTPPPAGSTATVTTPGESFSPAAVTITAGGTVTWSFTGVSRHNVTFTGQQPAGGNVPDTDVGGSATRTFAAAGTYPYTCTRHDGMNGQVVVQP
jgi:plastocyanin